MGFLDDPYAIYFKQNGSASSQSKTTRDQRFEADAEQAARMTLRDTSESSCSGFGLLELAIGS